MLRALSVVLQFAVLLCAAYVGVTFFVRDKALPERTVSTWSQREGFAALSYGGVSRTNQAGIIPKHLLEQHLKALADAGFTTITSSDIVAFYTNNAPLPEKPLYLMFEGGRKDSLIFSQPYLEELGLHAALFLHTDMTERIGRFFVKSDEMESIARSPYWEINAMGHRSAIINENASGKYTYFLADYLKNARGETLETNEALQARITQDYRHAFDIITQYAGLPPLAYVFMPANTLGSSLPEALEAANSAALRSYFKTAFTREGSCFNSRNTDSFALTRMQVSPDWSAETLLRKVSAQLPRKGPYDLSAQSSADDWKTALGDLEVQPDAVTLVSPSGKEASAFLRGTDRWRNYQCEMDYRPREGGFGAVYLRYQNRKSYVRVTLFPGRLVVQEKNDGKQATLLSQPMEPADTALHLAFTLKNNRLAVRIDGNAVSRFPIPLSRSIDAGAFGLGSFGEAARYSAAFHSVALKPFPPQWIEMQGFEELSPDQEAYVTNVSVPFSVVASGNPDILVKVFSYRAVGIAASVALSVTELDDLKRIDDFFTTRVLSIPVKRLFTSIVIPFDADTDLAAVQRAFSLSGSLGIDVVLQCSTEGVSRLLQLENPLPAAWILAPAPADLAEDTAAALKHAYERNNILNRETVFSNNSILYSREPQP